VALLWIRIALMLPLSGLAAAAMLAHRTPDLSAVQTTLQPEEQALHNLPNKLFQTSIKQSAPDELTEGELNEYLSRRIVSEQKGLSSRYAKLDSVLLDLDDGLCRVHLCWNVFGHRTVATVEFSITRAEDHFEIEIKRGAYGALPVPRALLPPMLPALQELVHACQSEIDGFFKLPHIKLAKNKVVLNPKF
jgi:hypothetical protein